MPERRRIVGLWRRGLGRVLVTLVRVEGSSYRRPGARLLVGAAGEYEGTISGGCLETEVTRKAGWIVRGGAAVERYSTLFDDTAEIPFGLGCGGTVDLLFEAMGTEEAEVLLGAMEASLAGRQALVRTWLPGVGRRLGRVIESGSGEVLFRSPWLTDEDLASEEGVYRERLSSPQRLVVIGAGDDARPVAAMAGLLGWNVDVVDGRGQMARTERFAGARSVGVVEDFGALDVGERDAVVLMTHSYEQDRAALAALLGRPRVRYVGILGARHRTALLVAEASSMAGVTVEETCDRIHAPIGLDLGGDGPEAIALAIVAEVQASCQGRLPASRRLTAEDVAGQIAEGGASRYLSAQCGVA